MKWFIACAAATVALAFVPVAASAGHCPAGTVETCSSMGLAAPPKCQCVPVGGSGYGAASGGRGEVKKKNVPQVQPNR